MHAQISTVTQKIFLLDLVHFDRFKSTSVSLCLIECFEDTARRESLLQMNVQYKLKPRCAPQLQ